MTPDEARAKLCHRCNHMREAYDAAVNARDIIAAHEAEHGSRCVADACMAWRWASALTVNNPSRGRGAIKVGQKISRTHGFCGLAGQP